MGKLAYLEQKYELQCNLIQLPGRSIRILTVADVSVLLDSISCEDDLPFWAQLWPAARGLAAYLWQDESIVGIRSLELGAGTGLGGIAAALRGAHVVQTDYVVDALLFCRVNAHLNDAKNISHELADWRSFHLDGEYPLIFGSDILYEKDLHAYLVSLMDRKLAPGGRILIADPGRKTAMDFLHRAEAAGFSWNVEEIMLVQESCGDPDTQGTGTAPRTIAIDILELSRR